MRFKSLNIHEINLTNINDVFSSVTMLTVHSLGVCTHDDKFQTYLRCIRTEEDFLIKAFRRRLGRKNHDAVKTKTIISKGENGGS